MNINHEKAREAIHDLYNNASISPQERIHLFRDLIDEIKSRMTLLDLQILKHIELLDLEPRR